MDESEARRRLGSISEALREIEEEETLTDEEIAEEEVRAKILRATHGLFRSIENGPIDGFLGRLKRIDDDNLKAEAGKRGLPIPGINVRAVPETHVSEEAVGLTPVLYAILLHDRQITQTSSRFRAALFETGLLELILEIVGHDDFDYETNKVVAKEIDRARGANGFFAAELERARALNEVVSQWEEVYRRKPPVTNLGQSLDLE